MAASPAPSAPPAPRRRRAATARDMVISMVVLLGGVVAFTLIRPHSHQDPVQQVDVGTEVQVLAGAAPYTLLAPAGLPADWRPTSVHASTPESVGPQVADLTIGYVVDRSPRTFAELIESNAPAATVLRTEGIGARPPAGTVTIGAAAWQVRRDAAGHTALVRTAGGVTLVASDGGGSGGATQFDLTVLAASLRPVPKTAA